MTAAIVEGILLVVLTWAGIVSVRSGLFDVALEAKFSAGIVATLLAWRWLPGVLRPNMMLAYFVTSCFAILAAGLVGYVYGWLTAKKRLDAIVSGVALNASIIPIAVLMFSRWYQPWERGEPAVRNLSTRLTEVNTEPYLWSIGLLALLGSLVLAWWLRNTRSGTRLVAAGLSRSAAEEAGIDVSAVCSHASTVAGCVCGLAGALYVWLIAPSSYNVDSTLGRGFLALATTLVGRTVVLPVCLLAFGLGTIKVIARTIVSELMVGRMDQSTIGFIADGAPYAIILIVLSVVRFIFRSPNALVTRPGSTYS